MEKIEVIASVVNSHSQAIKKLVNKIYELTKEKEELKKRVSSLETEIAKQKFSKSTFGFNPFGG